MATVDLPKNSDKLNDEKPKIDKVVQGPVMVQKKSEVTKLAKGFFAEDAKNVKSYLLNEILVPSLKKLFEEIVVNGVSTILWGESRAKNDIRKSSLSRVSYNKFYDDRVSYSRRDYGRSGYEMEDDVIFQSEHQANDALAFMDEVIARYGVVRMSDFYEYLEQPFPFTYNNYGWANLRGARAVRTRRGWILDLPKAMPID